jgi:hypothetical protein
MPSQFFYKMIERLRHHEEIMLYDNVLAISEEEKRLVTAFLETEFQRESLNYPRGYPGFTEDAALWAAKTTYVAAQLILYRQNKDEDLKTLLPDYPSEKSAGAFLSADLCLRFLPDMIRQLKIIDSGDPLIEVLQNILQQWHYSGIGYDELDFHAMKFETIVQNEALLQLYCTSIIYHKNTKLAQHPDFNEVIGAQLGIYNQEFWNEFKRITTPPLQI